MNNFLKAYFWQWLTFAKKAALRIVCGLGGIVLNFERAPSLKPVRRILVIHGEHASLGDAVLFSALLSPLRERFPKVRIDVLMRHPAEEVLKFNPNIDEIIPYHAEEKTNILTQELAPLKIAANLRRRKYDMVITSEHALRFIFLSFLTGAPTRVGYDAQGRGFLLTCKVPYPEYEKRNRRELEYYLDLVRALGVEIAASREMMKIHFSKSEAKFAAAFLKDARIGKNDLVIGIHAGGGIWKKRWPLYKFAKLADELIGKRGAKVIALGGKEDALLYEQIGRMMKKGKLIVAAGKCTVLETAALLENCHLVVCNDSAISHMAATTSAKVIALFGVDSPARWGPFGNVSIMKHRRLPACNVLCNYDYLYALDACFEPQTPFCMDRIGVGEVQEAADRALRFRLKSRRTPNFPSKISKGLKASWDKSLLS